MFCTIKPNLKQKRQKGKQERAVLEISDKA